MDKERILIDDDDKNICDLLRLYLEKDGYSVILSHDGEEAVVKFNALKPDMVLLDIMLPGIDGWQVCREIRKKAKVPILLIHGSGDTFVPCSMCETIYQNCASPKKKLIIEGAAHAECYYKDTAAYENALTEFIGGLKL